MEGMERSGGAGQGEGGLISAFVCLSAAIAGV